MNIHDACMTQINTGAHEFQRINENYEVPSDDFTVVKSEPL